MIILMGLGLLATAMAIAKLPSLRVFDKSDDIFYNNAMLGIWTYVTQAVSHILSHHESRSLELSIGIIATCIPVLKAPFERVLCQIGSKWSAFGSQSSQSSKTPTGLEGRTAAKTFPQIQTQESTFATRFLYGVGEEEIMESNEESFQVPKNHSDAV